MDPFVRGKARIVAADDDPDVGLEPSDVRDDAAGGAPLEGHDREPDQVRIDVGHQPGDGALHIRLHQHQIRNRHAMMRIDVAGEGSKAAVRHADGARRRMLERVGHREQENPHWLIGQLDNLVID